MMDDDVGIPIIKTDLEIDSLLLLDKHSISTEMEERKSLDMHR
jgi:hypothetical protein